MRATWVFYSPTPQSHYCTGTHPGVPEGVSFPHTLAAETILTDFLLFSPKDLSPRQGSSAASTQWAGLTPERGCGQGGLGESATVSRGEGGGRHAPLAWCGACSPPCRSAGPACCPRAVSSDGSPQWFHELTPVPLTTVQRHRAHSGCFPFTFPPSLDVCLLDRSLCV